MKKLVLDLKIRTLLLSFWVAILIAVLICSHSKVQFYLENASIWKYRFVIPTLRENQKEPLVKNFLDVANQLCAKQQGWKFSSSCQSKAFFLRSLFWKMIGFVPCGRNPIVQGFQKVLTTMIYHDILILFFPWLHAWFSPHSLNQKLQLSGRMFRRTLFVCLSRIGNLKVQKWQTSLINLLYLDVHPHILPKIKKWHLL